MTLMNEGILPVFSVRCGLAPGYMSVSGEPGTLEYPAMIVVGPNVKLVPSSADYAFQLRRPDCYAAVVSPGDGFTFTTEGLIGAPSGAVYDSVDFSINISYIPIFPPLPMQTCSHFHIYKDQTGNMHWFRATNKCSRFPWLHHWFDSPRPRR